MMSRIVGIDSQSENFSIDLEPLGMVRLNHSYVHPAAQRSQAAIRRNRTYKQVMDIF
jgi:hypothetical protein